MLIPIAIAIDISEKIDKFLRHGNLSSGDIIRDYYVNFIIIYGNTFMPLALFIAVIFFTSKMAGDTEIIAIHSAKVSFTRFLRPYFIGATIVTVLALLMNHFVVPSSNKIFNDFDRTYLKNKKFDSNYITNINLQLGPNDYIFLKNFTLTRNIGYNFSYEIFEGNKLKYKLMSDNIKWIEKDSTPKKDIILDKAALSRVTKNTETAIKTTHNNIKLNSHFFACSPNKIALDCTPINKSYCLS